VKELYTIHAFHCITRLEAINELIITSIRTAVDNGGTLDKEATSGMKIAVSDTDHIKNEECEIYYLWIV
jgi:hypothetical protein